MNGRIGTPVAMIAPPATALPSPDIAYAKLSVGIPAPDPKSTRPLLADHVNPGEKAPVTLSLQPAAIRPLAESPYTAERTVPAAYPVVESCPY